eukprot:Sspe_Gene.52458::Locus_29058_Transcript_1_6_Confidence_0.250_Length_610::g.52458::m.52458
MGVVIQSQGYLNGTRGEAEKVECRAVLFPEQALSSLPPPILPSPPTLPPCIQHCGGPYSQYPPHPTPSPASHSLPPSTRYNHFTTPLPLFHFLKGWATAHLLTHTHSMYTAFHHSTCQTSSCTVPPPPLPHSSPSPPSHAFAPGIRCSNPPPP